MSSNTGSAQNLGTDAGQRGRGVFEAIHGAGEALRGNINSALDGLGDGVANRPQGTVDSRQSAANEESVAQKGLNELSRGIDNIKGGNAAASSTTHTSTGTGI